MHDDYTIRALDFSSDAELNTAASFSMLTILETLPDARCDPSSVPNLSFDAMASMYADGASNPDHLYLVVEDARGELVGHAIALLREDDEGERHGYSYTRYVLPAHRRAGIASALLERALAWWRTHHAAYVLAHTHPTNSALRALFSRSGFVEVAREKKRWESVTLRLELTPA